MLAKIKKTVVLLFVGLLMNSLLALSLSAAPPLKPIVWTWAHGPSIPNNPYEIVTTELMPKIIDEATGGRLKIEVRQRLVPPADVLDAVRDRRVDGGLQGVMYRGEIELWNWQSLAFLSLDDVILLWPHVKPIIVPSFERDFKVVYLAWGPWQEQCVIGNKAIRTVEDFKGFKLRTHSRQAADLMAKLSAVPVTVAFGEVYQSLQRHVIDGAISGWDAYMAMKWGEIAHYVNTWPVGQTAYTLIANKDSWAALPDDLKPIVRDAFAKVEIETFKAAKQQMENALEGLKKPEWAKIQWVTPSRKETAKLVELGSPIADDWAKRAGPDGPKVLQIVNKFLGH
jgi:TRAP-type C4-dicarboxylate transport system substrate-binding protein